MKNIGFLFVKISSFISAVSRSHSHFCGSHFNDLNGTWKKAIAFIKELIIIFFTQTTTSKQALVYFFRIY